MNAEDTAIAALLGMNHDELPSPNSNVDDLSSSENKKRKPDTAPQSSAQMGQFFPTSSTSNSTLGVPDAFATNPKPKRRKRNKVHYIEPSFPVAPRVVQVCKMPKTHVDHSYKDCSSVPPDPSYRFPAKISEMSFSEKLHDILSRKEYNDAMVWMPHGRAFRIVVPKRLEKDNILQTYFGHNRYSTFLSQLKNYGLKQITQGRDRTCYYHEYMLRGLPHLSKYMPEFKEGRKLLPDPANEPDFYTISMLWPVPEATPLRSANPLSTVNINNNNNNAVQPANLVPANQSTQPSNLFSLQQLLGLQTSPTPALPQSIVSYLNKSTASPPVVNTQQNNANALLQAALGQVPQQSNSTFMSTPTVSGVGLSASLAAALLQQSGGLKFN